MTIPLFKPFIPNWGRLGPMLQATFESGYIAQGPRVLEFEREFSQLIGAQSVAVSSCTAALHLSLIMAGIRPDDEVISTPLTAEPTNMAIMHAGGKIVWADVDCNGNIAPASVVNKITSKTKAIMVVHYGGVPVSLGSKLWPHRYTLIEDCAHALGAKSNGFQVGTLSDFGCFSFQAIKHLTTVDGGALVCQDLAKVKRLRWFGIDRSKGRESVDVFEVGYKYNFNEVSATLGLAQLANIDRVIELHKDNGQWFDRNLSDIKDLQLCKYDIEAEPSYWFYTVFTERRDHLQKHLKNNGIACGKIHRRNDKHSLFCRSKTDLPGLDEFERTALHIPCGWWVTQSDRKRIAETINEAMNA